jgi:hypothetical protein
VRDPGTADGLRSGDIFVPASRRGTFRSVKELITAIGGFIDAYDDRCHPFAWTKDADYLVAKSNRKETNATRH